MTETAQQIVMDLVKAELSQFKPAQIEKVLQLLEEGNTVPFIARYRKEATGSLDEVEIREIEERHQYATNLYKRKEEVIRIIEEQGKLTPKLKADIERAEKMQRVEDLYRPYKQKRRTKAAIAREKGLAPFAEWLMNGPTSGSLSVEAKAKEFLNEEMEPSTIEDVLAGAHEIIAEIVSDEPAYREHIREFTRKNGQVVSTVKDAESDEKGVFEMYYDFSQGVATAVPHRILAMNRGEKTGILKVAIAVDEEKIFAYLSKKVLKNPNSIAAPYVKAANEDSYRRFIGPAIERELRNELTEAADAQAIDVFGDNLRNLLLQPPLKGKVVLGLDPAY
ncbi:MAG: Tex-like N-terminal domain-containing protein, partial [Trichococcus flocculiformis]